MSVNSAPKLGGATPGDITTVSGIPKPVGAVGAAVQLLTQETDTHVPPLYDSKHCVVVLNINKLFAGLGMAFRSAVVIRGISNPFFGLIPLASTSSMALLLGGVPVALMPMFCE
ncbi:MAG: hypothetical protein Fur0023_00130 [Bacteroidia bacterium]